MNKFQFHQTKYWNYPQGQLNYSPKLPQLVWQTFKKLHSFAVNQTVVDYWEEKRSQMKDHNHQKNYHYANLKIGIIGIGNGGGNVINSYLKNNVIFNPQLKFLAINSDSQALRKINKIVQTIQINQNGSSSGGDWHIANKWAENSRKKIEQLLTGFDFVILIAAIGRGTGTGVTSVVANLAKAMGISVLSMVFYPQTKYVTITNQQQYSFWLNQIKKNTNSIIVLNNASFYQPNETQQQSFTNANQCMIQNLKTILDLAGGLYQDTDNADFLKMINHGAIWAIHNVIEPEVNDTFSNLNQKINSTLVQYMVDNNAQINGFLLAVKNGKQLTTNYQINQMIETLNNCVKQNATSFYSTFYHGYSHQNQISIIVTAKLKNKTTHLNQQFSTQKPMAELNVDHVNNANQELISSTTKLIIPQTKEDHLELNKNNHHFFKNKINLNNIQVNINNQDLLDSVTKLFVANKTSYAMNKSE